MRLKLKVLGYINTGAPNGLVERMLEVVPDEEMADFDSSFIQKVVMHLRSPEVASPRAVELAVRIVLAREEKMFRQKMPESFRALAAVLLKPFAQLRRADLASDAFHNRDATLEQIHLFRHVLSRDQRDSLDIVAVVLAALDRWHDAAAEGGGTASWASSVLRITSEPVIERFLTSLIDCKRFDVFYSVATVFVNELKAEGALLDTVGDLMAGRGAEALAQHFAKLGELATKLTVSTSLKTATETASAVLDCLVVLANFDLPLAVATLVPQSVSSFCKTLDESLRLLTEKDRRSVETSFRTKLAALRLPPADRAGARPERYSACLKVFTDTLGA